MKKTSRLLCLIGWLRQRGCLRQIACVQHLCISIGKHLQNGRARAIVVNSKNANACTGDQGMADARQMAQWVGGGLDVAPEDALVNSTGVIGVPLPMVCLETGIQNIIPQLDVGGWDDASEAIMTTDTVPKKASVRCEIDGCEITIAGIAKGAGMIAPNMATMLAFCAHRCSPFPRSTPKRAL